MLDFHYLCLFCGDSDQAYSYNNCKVVKRKCKDIKNMQEDELFNQLFDDRFLHL